VSGSFGCSLSISIQVFVISLFALGANGGALLIEHIGPPSKSRLSLNGQVVEMLTTGTNLSNSTKRRIATDKTYIASIFIRLRFDLGIIDSLPVWPNSTYMVLGVCSFVALHTLRVFLVFDPEAVDRLQVVARCAAFITLGNISRHMLGVEERPEIPYQPNLYL